MLLRVESSVLTPIWRRIIVPLGVYSIWSWFVLSHSIAQTGQKGGALQGPSEMFRLEVSDVENNRPLASASVTLVLWQHENGSQRRKELEARTDENGVVVFPRVQVERLTVSVEAKGYRSISRWINPKDLGRVIRIRLEKWRQVSK